MSGTPSKGKCPISGGLEKLEISGLVDGYLLFAKEGSFVSM